MEKLSCHSDLLGEIPPLVIAIDDREKAGHALSFPAGIKTQTAHLPFGDYSLIGFERRVAVERKSIKDLVQTIWGNTELEDGTRQRNVERFAHELNRMREAGAFGYVAIEGTERDLERHFSVRARVVERFGKKQRATFASTIGKISSLEVHTGICFKFFRDANDAAAHIYATLYHAYRMIVGLSASPIGTYKSPQEKGAATKPPPKASSVLAFLD